MNTPGDKLLCYHCDLPVPADADYEVSIDGEPRQMCCAGCQAVAQAIVDAGHESFYQQRTAPATTGEELVPAFLRQTTAYDHPDIQKSFVHQIDGSTREAALILEGITCAACVWLNEQHIAALPGVIDVQINYSTHRAQVRWDPEKIRLSEILQAIHAIGYQAHPYDPQQQQLVFERMRKDSLLRIGIAGLFGMQVMMISLALYVGDWLGIDPEFEKFFRWLLAGLTLPVALYSAYPFYHSAWRDLRQKRIGMDVPVTLGIGIAYFTSLFATWQHHGHVYYDSVVMFTFFLLSSRHFELAARKQNAEASESLALAKPTMATRMAVNGEELVPVGELCTGDRVLIRPGEQVPSDGIIINGRSGIDESILTGESMPVTHGPGDKLIGGSMNTESPLQMRVTEIGQDTVLSRILQLLQNAEHNKPRMASIAERVASRFVGTILLLATAVAIYWWRADPDRWLEITMSVLIVTCPCALSLAAPTAISTATGALQKLGLLVIRGHSLETLSKITHFAFDKTGTLTLGQPMLTQTWTTDDHDQQSVLKLAAALETGSEHPLAKGLIVAAKELSLPAATDIQNIPGSGVTAMIDGQRYRLGTPAFISEHLATEFPEEALRSTRDLGATPVALADDNHLIAVFSMLDTLRPDAADMIQEIKKAGLQTLLLTGDQESAAKKIAAQTGIESSIARLSPEGKLKHLNRLQQHGAVVAMAGDGINDAPILAAANLSIAMGSAAQLSHTNADMILLSNQLPVLASAVRLARKTRWIMTENMGWAILYNLLALPAAAIGWLAPWMAALGMSISSLVVVLNSMRLARTRARKSTS